MPGLGAAFYNDVAPTALEIGHEMESPRGLNAALFQPPPLGACSRHASVRLKKIGVLYTARIGLHYRALAKERPDGLQWSGSATTRPTTNCSSP
jgi:hypothetical protein